MTRQIKNICLATNNSDKIKEIRKILQPDNYRLRTLSLPGRLLDLKSLKLKIDIKETGKTLRKNAYLKALAVSKETGIPTLSDDTGLFVRALKGKPGVRSSRFAGENVNYTDNVNKLLKLMKNKTDCRAYFETVVCFYINPKKYFFRTGRVYGKIIPHRRGTSGFGYDPVFYYPALRKTFAELTALEKNRISHRKIAFEKIKTIIYKFT